MNTAWMQFGCLSMGAAVGLDAFGYHVLTAKKRTNDPYYRQIWRIGAVYHFVHSLSIMFMATQNLPNVNLINGIFTLGMALFPGSLYAIAMFKNRKFGHITPFGGITLMIGWFMSYLAQRSKAQ